MPDTLITLNPATCPECRESLDKCSIRCLAGSSHNVTCNFAWDYARERQVMLWDRVRPSLGSLCPKRGCGLEMATWTVEHIEMQQCSCGYAVRSTEGGLKWAR